MKTKSLLIESHYLPSLEYIALLSQYDRVDIEMQENFQKQSYRNRCYILGANKVMKLIVPVKKKQDRRMAVMEIDYRDNWIKDHWRSIESCYNRSPFFLYYKDELHEIIHRKHQYLSELNRDLLTFCLNKLQYNISVNYTTEYVKEADEGGVDDFRGIINAKMSYTSRNIISGHSYFQMFGKTFVSNLSILDVLFCEGPVSREIIGTSLNN